MVHLTIDQALQAAVAHHQAGRLPQAEQLYRQILEQYPGHVSATHYLGLVAFQVGRHDAAVELIRRALELGPDYAEAHGNLGLVLQSAGRLDEAIAAHRDAIALMPNVPESHNNLGNALRSNGQFDEAIAAYQKAISLRPDYAEALSNLGNVLRERGRLDEAVTAHLQALTFKPDRALAHNNLGDAFREEGRLDDALASYRMAVIFDPAAPEPHSNVVYTAGFHPAYGPKKILEEARAWSRMHADPLAAQIHRFDDERLHDRPLRIGYVSPNFCDHVVGRWMLPLAENHDRKRFRIFYYSDVRRPDMLTARLQSHADGWRNIRGISDAKVAEVIRQDQIDVLVDLTKHMADNRLLVFARKPAPIQVTWLAYPGTTGLDVMDYRLTDRFLDPPVAGEEENGIACGQEVYSEKSIRLPDSWCCYRPCEDCPSVNRLPALAARCLTFGCLNDFAKVRSEVLLGWSILLRQVPNSRLLLCAPQGRHRNEVKYFFARHGVDPDRVRFVGGMPLPQYLRLYHQIDIGLDTFPFSGSATSCDALWMGVPVVSLSGRTSMSRGTATFLHAIGLPQLIADSPEKYLKIATELARDVAGLTILRATLRQKMAASNLMNEARFARTMEAAYRGMWSYWRQHPAERKGRHTPQVEFDQAV